MPLRTVDAATLKSWLATDDVVIVDVREPSEYEQGAIPGSTLLPLSRVSVEELPSYTGKKLVVHCMRGRRGGTACEKLLAQDPDLEIFNLEGGIDAWKEAGYDVSIPSLTSSSSSSSSSSPPASGVSSANADSCCGEQKSDCTRFCTPLCSKRCSRFCPIFCLRSCCLSALSPERQTQLVIGLAVVFGVFLGRFISAYFLWVPFILGCGLTYAGWSGSCRLTQLILKMPWNKQKKP